MSRGSKNEIPKRMDNDLFFQFTFNHTFLWYLIPHISSGQDRLNIILLLGSHQKCHQFRSSICLGIGSTATQCI
jgi:hypothetical protein